MGALGSVTGDDAVAPLEAHRILLRVPSYQQP